jgi:hypothetical protein
MSDFFERQPDPIDALLAPPSIASDDAFRQGVLARTTTVLRRRQRLKRLTRVAALAACYVAGLMTMHRIRSVAPPALRSVVTAPEPPAAAQSSALALEWEAVDSPEQASTLYRTAGDRYLADETDPQAAMRCYGNALSSGSAEDLTVEPSDSWLLMAIKDARQKEKDDAKRVE